MRNKWEAIKAEVITYRPDIICISESWLSEDETSNYQFDNFVAFADCRVGRRGGGVLMLIDAKLKPRKAIAGSVDTAPCNVVSAYIGSASKPVLISTVYRPPAVPWGETKRFFDHLASYPMTENRVIIGDFNMPFIDWQNPALTKHDGLHDAFQEACDDLLLYQCVDVPTLGNNILDLVFVSSPSDVVKCQIFPPIAMADHMSTLFTYRIQHEQQRRDCYLRLNFARTDFIKANALLRALDWRQIFQADRSVDDFAGSFMSALYSIIDASTPRKRWRPRGPRNLVPRRIRSLIMKKRKLWRKCLYNESYKEQYRQACKDVKRAIKLFNAHREQQLVDSPNLAGFYQHVNRAIGHVKQPFFLVSNDNHESCGKDSVSISTAEIFSREFAKNFSAPVSFVASEYAATDNSDAIYFNITAADTRNALRNCSNSAAGPDAIPGAILRKLADGVSLPLSIVFMQSIAQGCFPNCWKSALVIPVYKGKGSREQPSSYRPISLCSTIGKVLERLVKDQLLQSIETRSPLSKCQHGFSKNKSTITNLLITERIIADALNSNKPVDIITFDFSRAFDKVPHHMLMRELSSRGLSGSALSWIGSFLTDRTQSVKADGVSPPVPVSSGVIQGSVLGPVLFVIFIDSLLAKFKLPAIAYADDIKFVIDLASSSREEIDKDISVVWDWSVRMCMPLSLEKNTVCHLGSSNPLYVYKCGPGPIPVVDSFSDLGVMRSSDSCFNEHIARVVAKGRRLSGMCRRALTCRRADFLIRVYTTYVRPTLSYASVVWSPQFRYEINAIESIQRKFTKLVPSLKNSSYSHSLSCLNLLSLESHRIEADLIIVFKLIHNQIGISLSDAGLCLSANNTRSGTLRLEQSCARSARVSSLFKFRATRFWNSLPASVANSTNICAFRQKLRLWLMDADEHFFAD